MKLIVAIIQPTKLQAIKEALKEVSIERMTVCDAHGFGRQRGQVETFRGHEYQIQFLRKISLEIAVNDDFVERALEIVQRVARTGAKGNIGDGKVFVMPIEQAIRIDDSVSGPEAI